jgi:hypothetical protein
MIMAILIMSAVVAIGITMSTVVITQVRINEVVSSNHEGYYAAESGLEQGLHAVQTLKSSSTLAAALTELQALTLPDAVSITTQNEAFFGATDTKLAGSTDETSLDETIPELKENQSVYIEMYDVDDSLGVLSAPPEFCVYAESGGGDDEVLEVTWVGWTDSLESSRSQRVLVSTSSFSDISACPILGSDGHGAPILLTQFYPAFITTNALAGFRIRITPLKPTSGNGDVKNFAVFMNPKPKSQIKLKSVSSGKNQKQALVATFPWTLPLSSLFDFVIFSEQSLTKSVELSVAEDVKTYGPFSVPVAGEATDVPSAPNNPFAPGVCIGCSYYMRITGTNLPALTVSMTNDGAPAGSRTLSAKSPFTSCIVALPFGPFTDGASHQVTFGALGQDLSGLTGYQLLTQPSFIGPEEGFCPTS